MRNVHSREVAAPIERVRPWIDAGWTGTSRDGNAAHAYAATMTLFARYSPALQAPLLPSLSSLQPQLLEAQFQELQLPSFQTLFGSLDACACDDCASIHGPAAYLVDLLQFLGPMFSQLHAIRPDIARTELSCRSTNTELPYIDLVNEVLENAVAPPNPPKDVYATTWSAPDLLAQPEHVNDAAYAVLKSATYPWTLPFDLHRAEAMATRPSPVQTCSLGRWRLRDSRARRPLRHRPAVAPGPHAHKSYYVNYTRIDGRRVAALIGVSVAPEIRRRTT